MRRLLTAGAAAAALVLSSLAFAPAASAASGTGQLKLCVADGDGEGKLSIYADGPSLKTADVEEGECKKFDVKPGQYLVDLDLNSYEDLAEAEEGCEPQFIVRRGGERYTTFFGALTNVRKDKTTKVKIDIVCDGELLENGVGDDEEEVTEDAGDPLS